MRNEFSISQEKWKDTTKADGFIAQAGGWNLLNLNEACIISFWNDKKSLDWFMQNLHDEIFHSNKQIVTYKRINVGYFDKVLNMEGKVNSFTEAVEKSKFLRIADCNVKPNKAEHFDNMQKEVWLPGMRHAKGMLAGVFSKNNLRYLVSTFWDSKENHTKFTEDILPGLKAKANVVNDITNIAGMKILLVDSWKIIKDKNLT
jgi:hypothetical protein